MYLTLPMKEYLQGLIDCGLASRKVRKMFLLRFDRTISPQTVRNYRNPKVKVPNKKGPKKITSSEEDRICLEVVEANRWLSWRSLSIILQGRGIHVSWRTLQERCKSLGLRSYVAKKKPWITEPLSVRRLLFARLLIQLPDEKFRTFLFLDEGRINLISEDCDRIWVKRRKNQSIQPGITKRKMKYRGGGVGLSFFAGVSYHGPGELVYIDTKLNGAIYKGILEENLTKCVTQAGLDLQDFSVIEDSAPYHKSMLVRDFYSDSSIVRWLLSGNSPDMNIIETVFFELKKRVVNGRERFRNLVSLRIAIDRVWEELREEKDYFKYLVDGYRRRLQKIIDNNGYNTKY